MAREGGRSETLGNFIVIDVALEALWLFVNSGWVSLLINELHRLGWVGLNGGDVHDRNYRYHRLRASHHTKENKKRW